MKHEFTQKVYYSDTDAYSVVWHGSYLRWMEKGRVDFCEDLGLNLVTLQEQDIALPVTNINIRYKASAKLNETVVIETQLTKMTPLLVTFTQTIRNKETDRIYVQAEVDVVAVTNEGKLYRRIPETLRTTLEKVLVCKD